MTAASIRSLVKETAIYGISGVIGRSMGLILMPVLTNLLPEDQFRRLQDGVCPDRPSSTGTDVRHGQLTGALPYRLHRRQTCIQHAFLAPDDSEHHRLRLAVRFRSGSSLHIFSQSYTGRNHTYPSGCGDCLAGNTQYPPLQPSQGQTETFPLLRGSSAFSGWSTAPWWSILSRFPQYGNDRCTDGQTRWAVQ